MKLGHCGPGMYMNETGIQGLIQMNENGTQWASYT